jgi:hypothetical protein
VRPRVAPCNSCLPMNNTYAIPISTAVGAMLP